jgi:hypothetical protein
MSANWVNREGMDGVWFCRRAARIGPDRAEFRHREIEYETPGGARVQERNREHIPGLGQLDAGGRLGVQEIEGGR